MDISTIILVIIGIILAAAGITALISAFNIRVKTLQANIDQQTQLALAQTHIDRELHAHALTQAKLENTEQELGRYKTGMNTAKGVFLAFGMVHPDADLLQLTREDIIIEGNLPQDTATQTDLQGLPTVPGLTVQELIEALLHAANRTGPRSDRPFSRRYMVDDGPLTKTKFDNLIKTLGSQEYIEKIGNSPTLTTRGQALLNRIKNGQY